VKDLRPIRETASDYEEIEKALIALFKKEIYLPLLALLSEKSSTLKNSRDELIDAILSGRIRFYRGSFSGRFSSTLSKELRNFGAEWDRKQGWWKIPRSKLSPEILNAIDQAEARFEQTARRIDRKLDELLSAEIADKLKIEELFDRTIWRVEKRFEDSVKNIEVAAKMTPDRARRISAEYSENMKLYIKDWTEKEIVTLRKKVSESTFKGVRYESMIATIQKSYGVSQSKAKFLARQETSLLRTKYVETRYQEAGVNSYRWQTVLGTPAHPVRPMHKALNGKIFTWDNPPVTSEDGQRNNPGQDYNCRCVAVPMVNYKK